MSAKSVLLEPQHLLDPTLEHTLIVVKPDGYARGLTGEQGVIIPRANVTNLMLDETVLEAVRAGLFHVYAVRQADEALSRLVGEPAGAPDAKGRFPDGSVNARVVQRLKEIAELELEDELAEKLSDHSKAKGKNNEAEEN